MVLSDNTQLLYQFNWVEQTVLSLVCATNTLWLPIFMYQIWELNHLIKVLEEFDDQNVLSKKSKDIIKKPWVQQKLTADEYIEKRNQRMKKELGWRKSIHTSVVAAFIPFCISNAVFILPFKLDNEKLNLIVTGTCHSIMLLTYCLLFGVFTYL